MVLTTVNVSTTIYDGEGQPVPGARVYAELTNLDIDASAPGYVTTRPLARYVADINGDVTMPLWPNVAGMTSSRYHITAYTANGRDLLLDVYAAVPAIDCRLSEIAGLPAYPGAAEPVAFAAHLTDPDNPHATTAAQVGADATGTAVAAVAAHEAAGDPHPQYVLDTRADDLELLIWMGA